MTQRLRKPEITSTHYVGEECRLTSEAAKRENDKKYRQKKSSRFLGAHEAGILRVSRSRRAAGG